MKPAHNALLTYQWLALAGGAAAAGVFLGFGDIPNGLSSLAVSFLALIALKLEVWSLR